MTKVTFSSISPSPHLKICKGLLPDFSLRPHFIIFKTHTCRNYGPSDINVHSDQAAAGSFDHDLRNVKMFLDCTRVMVNVRKQRQSSVVKY